MSELSFTIPIAPKSWKRTNYWKGRHLTDKGQRDYQKTVALHAASERPEGWSLDGVFLVELMFVCGSRHRNDVDNLAKNILDACNEVLWADDSQVHRLVTAKDYDKASPRIEVLVSRRAA